MSPIPKQPDQLGLDLAKRNHRNFRRLADDTWFVPNGDKIFVVTPARPSCTCRDFEQTRTSCEHVWAVAYVQNGVTLIDGTRLVMPPVTDPRDWLISLVLAVGS